MREASFVQLVDEFVDFDIAAEFGSGASQSPFRVGQWLVSSLGLSLVAAGTDYSDGYWAARFLERIDTRSSAEMLEWDRRSARAWIRNNIRALPPEVVEAVAPQLEPGVALESSAWHAVVESVDWEGVGYWGPGKQRRAPQLQRARGLLVLTRLVSGELGPHAALAFMIGANRALDGISPIMFVRLHSFRRFGEALGAADEFLDRVA